MKYRVQTLNDSAFHEHAQRLRALALSGFTPDLYIGIRTGGYVLAERMVQPGETLLSVTCRRASTAQKQKKAGLLKSVLGRLPYFISNQLRVLEHYFLTQRKKPAAKKDFSLFADEQAALEEALRAYPQGAKILLIDDAVDSGATFEAVRRAVQQVAGPSSDVRLAALTVTTDQPLVEPEFALYRNVLCRFPWSFDFHG